jgi:hypothetical protein
VDIDFSKEMKNTVRKSGSLKERSFFERSESMGRNLQTIEVIKAVVQGLRDDGYTPAEVEGFFEFASRVCNFIKI